MISHPSETEIEAWHAGEYNAEIAAHIARCPTCRAVARELDHERELFLARETPEEFVRALRLRENPVPSRRPYTWPHAVGLGVACAAALALAILPLRQSGPQHDTTPARALVERAVATPASPLASKGGPALAIIRDRGGEQTLERSSVIVMPGDKLRVAFRLAAERRVAAAVLVDDGSWVSLFDGHFAAGAHAPEQTLQVDARPNAGRLVFGSPEQVEAARRHGDLSRVQVIELVWRPRHEDS